MFIFRFFVLLLLANIIFACGTDTIDQASQSNMDSTKKETLSPNVKSPGSGPKFEGFVANAFEVTVDGQSYKDLEDFYTQEALRLPVKIAKAGYSPSAKIKFEAAIGFRDLWDRMTVYVSSAGDTGYQASTTITGNGAFSIDLPADAINDNYRVRANKRIRILINDNNKTTAICYNFSAIEQSVAFNETSKPVLLDSFQTSLTLYDCAMENLGDSSSSLGIPQETSNALQLRPGASKSEVISVLGTVGLSIENSKVWCWDARLSKNEVCAISNSGSCGCSVQFDESDHLVQVLNIRVAHLDVSAW